MDVKAIIFLVPISTFDEKLEGHSVINQLEDSINSWTAVCKSKLLGKVNFYCSFSSLTEQELMSPCHAGPIDSLP